jgi:hypothetical protein
MKALQIRVLRCEPPRGIGGREREREGGRGEYRSDRFQPKLEAVLFVN